MTIAKPQTTKAAAGQPNAGVMSMLLAIVLASVCSGGAAFLAGSQLPQLLMRDTITGWSAPPSLQTPPSNVQVVNLPSIITNLSDKTHWVRLEAAVLIESGNSVPVDLAARLAQDSTALLRSLSMSQITGPSGFQHLRSELRFRLRARSSDNVRDVIIQSLLVE
jgi:flagellar FliL protein